MTFGLKVQSQKTTGRLFCLTEASHLEEHDLSPSVPGDIGLAQCGCDSANDQPSPHICRPALYSPMEVNTSATTWTAPYAPSRLYIDESRLDPSTPMPHPATVSKTDPDLRAANWTFRFPTRFQSWSLMAPPGAAIPSARVEKGGNTVSFEGWVKGAGGRLSRWASR